MIFEPTSESLRRDYPILKNYDEFITLTEHELLFVWYFGCKSSPFYGLNERERLVKCFEQLNEFAKGLKESVYNAYVELKFPNHIVEAIKIMNSFEPEKRQMASDINDRILRNLVKISQIDVDDDKYQSLDDKKVIVDMQINIAKNIAPILENYEFGFGTKKIDKKNNKELSVFEE